MATQLQKAARENKKGRSRHQMKVAARYRQSGATGRACRKVMATPPQPAARENK